MKKNLVKVLVLALFLSFFACSKNNLLDKKFSFDTLEQDLTEFQESGKVSDKDIETIAAAIFVATFSDESLEGKTYKEILEEGKNMKEKMGQ
jgi:hypothetical protein